MSRRTLLAAGVRAGALVGAVLQPDVASARVRETRNERAVRNWYNLWVDNRDWAAFDAAMTDDFTFTAASGEDHISKTQFKSECWQNQIGHIKRFDLEQMVSKGHEVFVKYRCRTMGGAAFRNVELLRVREGKIASIECYFGSTAGYPTAADSKNS